MRVPCSHDPGTAAQATNMRRFCLWWTSALPALVGVALPALLGPPGFAFEWLHAAEFAVIVLCFYFGFCALMHRFDRDRPKRTQGRRLLIAGTVCLGVGSLTAFHIQSTLVLHNGVFEWIFLVYCCTFAFLGVLYAIPPLRFRDRAGGEIVLAEGLAMMPVIGGFLVEVGDITRGVYIASLPMMVSMWIWIWTDELITACDDQRSGRRTLVLVLGERFSSLLILPTLLVGYVVTVLGAVAAGALPLSALSLLGVLLLGRRITAAGRAKEGRIVKLIRARRSAKLLYLFTCCVLVIALAIEYATHGSR